MWFYFLNNKTYSNILYQSTITARNCVRANLKLQKTSFIAH